LPLSPLERVSAVSSGDRAIAVHLSTALAHRLKLEPRGKVRVEHAGDWLVLSRTNGAEPSFLIAYPIVGGYALTIRAMFMPRVTVPGGRVTLPYIIRENCVLVDLRPLRGAKE